MSYFINNDCVGCTFCYNECPTMAIVKKLGVEILTQHTAKQLITDENGTIIGVLAADPGGETIIDGKTCLLCIGSLIRSKIMEKVLPEFTDTVAKRYAHDMPGLDGDALIMAENAGIPLDYDSICMAFVGCMPLAFDEEVFQQGGRCDALRVNLDGKRWCNEGINIRIAARKLVEQPKSISYTVIDSAILKSDVLGPSHGPTNMMPGSIPDVPDAIDGGRMMYPGGIPDFAVIRGERTKPEPEAMKEFVKLADKCVCYGDTLEELAGNMGIDVDTFMSTVGRYNELCEKGHDQDFLKQPGYMVPLKEGPFFAFKNYLYLDGIFGGLAINENMEVVGKNGPLAGLYAAGDIIGGRYTNDKYHKTEIINDYSWAVASGFIAASSAAEFLANK